VSHYWDVACLDCDDELGLRVNKDPKGVARLVATAPSLAVLGESWPNIHIDVYESFLLSPETGIIPAGWFARHKGHRLVVRDEYNGVYGDCNEWGEGGEGGWDFICRLPKGHLGDHVFSKRK